MGAGARDHVGTSAPGATGRQTRGIAAQDDGLDEAIRRVGDRLQGRSEVANGLVVKRIHSEAIAVEDGQQ